jgi:mono/diheme cytochrome c family protein
MARTRALAAAVLALACGGCDKKASGDPVRDVFDSQCATCHGKGGRGDGPTARYLSPPPRDYTDPSWQAATSDERIRTIIVRGGPSVGKSANMPSFPQLEGKPELLDGLVRVVRDFDRTRAAGTAGADE